MKHIHEKIEKTLLMLRDLEVVQQINCRGFQYKVTGYKEGNRVPVVDDTWEELTDNILISEKEVHTWIVGDVRIPKVKEGEYAVLEFYESNTKCDVQTCFRSLIRIIFGQGLRMIKSTGWLFIIIIP